MTLDDLTEFARTKVPFYGEVSSFEQCPIVSKRIILGDIDRFIARDAPRRAELLQFLRSETKDGVSEIDWGNGIVVEQTSGSSGIPFRIPKWKADRVQTSGAIWRFRKMIDSDAAPTRLYAAIHAPSDATRFPWVSLFGALQAQQIRWIHANPSILAEMASRARRAADRPSSLKFAESSGQYLAPDVWRETEAALQVRVVDQYGCREVSAIGYATEPNRFQLMRENAHVELLNAEGEPIQKPGIPGRVVVTSLHNRLMPFLRYDTGDEAEWVDGNGTRVLALRPFRPHHLIVGSKSVYGNSLFKGLLVAVYHRLGYPPISRLRVRQASRTRFVIETDARENAEPVRACLEHLFNTTRTLPQPAVFAIAPIDGMQDFAPTESKVDLFTNVGCH